MKKYYHERVIHGDEQTDDDPGKKLGEDGYPIWITNALNSVGIKLLP